MQQALARSPLLFGDRVFTRVMYHDIETASVLNLPDVGAYRYAEHASTRLLMVAWTFADFPVPVTDPRDPNAFKEPVRQWVADEDGDLPDEYLDALQDPQCLKIAHNSEFERTLLEALLLIELPVEEWICSMTWCHMVGLIGKLEKVGPILKLPEKFLKFKDGKRLIGIFCKPNRITKKRGSVWRDRLTDPEDWQMFKDYNRQDVETERFLVECRLARYMPSPAEWDSYHLSQHINKRGWPLDRQYITNADAMAQKEFAQIKGALMLLTGLDNPNSDSQFKPWARIHGYPFGDMRARTVAVALEDEHLDVNLRAALLFRKEMKMTAVKKYGAFLERLTVQDRLCGSYQFSGAQRTGRAAGRGAQMQNLKKPARHLKKYIADITASIRENDAEWLREAYGEVLTPLASAVRSSARARPGHQFVIADLSSIETCVIAWVTNCQSMLDIFRQGLDPYKVFATKWFGVAYDDVTKEMRDLCKPPMLGCGFRLSKGEEKIDPKTGDLKKTGLWGYGANMGIAMTQDQCEQAVTIYRGTYTEVEQFWYDIERAAKKAVQSPDNRRIRVSYETMGEGLTAYPVRIVFYKKGPYLICELPSGRKLYYLRPKIELVAMPWNKADKRPSLTYEGIEDSEDGSHKFWGRTPTHGGKLTENVVQAIANDILRFGIKVATWVYGFRIVGESHDELITHERADDPAHSCAKLVDAMTAKDDWFETCPLAAAGAEAEVYFKD